MVSWDKGFDRKTRYNDYYGIYGKNYKTIRSLETGREAHDEGLIRRAIRATGDYIKKK